jgi:hypothetical protein
VIAVSEATRQDLMVNCFDFKRCFVYGWTDGKLSNSADLGVFYAFIDAQSEWATTNGSNACMGPGTLFTDPQIAAAAKGLLYAEIDWDVFGYKEPPRRNRSMGTHAGGVIISSKPITDLVPLVRGKDGARASAWVEGLHGQDLSLVGLVKFDCLVIEALTKVSMAIDFIRKRNPGIHKIMAVPGGPNFSDLSYLNDPACLKAAADGDLKMIFQFDSEYIRKLAMSGGITSFDDMVALTALNRPGPMELGMDYEFVNRKKWKDSGGREGTAYHLHPLMEELVGTSYGVLVYQEDIMRVLNRVGLIPLSEEHTSELQSH